ncbi:MAG: Rrf2 family transcriptional regulator [Thermomicrobiales bacterium]
MRLELSSDGRYAIRALVFLASHPERVSASVISAETSIPRRLLARILANLSRAGLVESKPGRDGGAMLARRASEVSLRDVVEAVEGPFQVSQCIMESRACDGSRPCVMHSAWLVAQQALLDDLARHSLDDLVRSVEAATAIELLEAE